MPALRLVSADSHVNEPPEMFGERLDARWRSRALRTEIVDGVGCLVMEGMRVRKLPKGRDALTGEALERAQAGGWEPALRIRDQDRDGVSGEVVLPTLALQACFMAPDAALQMALAQAYNSWVAEVFGGHRERFAPAAVIPMLDVDAACAEAKRAASLGLRTLFLPSRLPQGAYNESRFDRFWTLSQELGVPLTFHAGGGTRAADRARRRRCRHQLPPRLASRRRARCLLLRGERILDRFPRLHVVTVETGSAWLGWVMTQMDEIYEKHHMWAQPKLSLKPSELCRRRVHVTFQNDPVGVHNRSFTGVG
jgi:Amidohydrolase